MTIGKYAWKITLIVIVVQQQKDEISVKRRQILLPLSCDCSNFMFESFISSRYMTKYYIITQDLVSF